MKNVTCSKPGYESITSSGLGLGLWCLMPLSTIFQLYRGVEKLKLFPQRKPPTMGKQLVNFITCGCELSAPFL
jgi:hypothetical protein